MQFLIFCYGVLLYFISFVSLFLFPLLNKQSSFHQNSYLNQVNSPISSILTFPDKLPQPGMLINETNQTVVFIGTNADNTHVYPHLLDSQIVSTADSDLLSFEFQKFGQNTKDLHVFSSNDYISLSKRCGFTQLHLENVYYLTNKAIIVFLSERKAAPLYEMLPLIGAKPNYYLES